MVRRFYAGSSPVVVSLVVVWLVGALFGLLSGFAQVASAQERQPVSVGASYSYPGKGPLRAYPDPEVKKLTDGVLAPTASYTDPNWVGFWSTEPFAILIDLGKSVPITQVRSHHMAGIAGITWPTRFFVMVSDDQITWSEPLEIVEPDYTPSEAQMRWISFDNLNLQGRYVQLVYFPPTEGKNIFISEIEVY